MEAAASKTELKQNVTFSWTLKQANKYISKLNGNLLKIPSSRRLTSWATTRRGGVKSGTTQHKTGDLVTGMGFACLPRFVGECSGMLAPFVFKSKMCRLF